MFMIGSFKAEKFLSLTSLFFSLIVLLLVSYIRHQSLIQSHENMHLFSAKKFIVLVLMFGSLIYFEFIL